MSVRLLTAALALGLGVVGRAVAAPPDDRILPVDQYTSEKARTLARKYAPALRDLNAGIYHCLPASSRSTRSRVAPSSGSTRRTRASVAFGFSIPEM